MAGENGVNSGNGGTGGGADSKVTITAIAREAGVSVPTVSRVVNGRPAVAPQTRARVVELPR